MQLKNLATVSFGVLLSVKAMAYEDELHTADLTPVSYTHLTLPTNREV